MATSSSSLPRFLTRKGVPLWRDVVVLQWVAQIISAILVVGFLWFFISNVLAAAEARGLGLGFDFLRNSAGFPIAESPVPYDPSRTFGYALWVGFLNTLKVSVVGIVLATFLGLAAALARLSSNWLVSSLAGVYINIIRNIPLLVQLFIWYFAVFQRLPPVQNALTLPGPIFISQRGLYMVGPQPTGTFGLWLLFVAAGLLLGYLLHRYLLAYQMRTGRSRYPLLIGLLAAAGVALLGWFVVGAAPLRLTTPELGRFNFEGGVRLTPEFAALLVGLVVYTGAFIAEVMRAGILAVQKGQVEAAKSLGLSAFQTLRLVVLPLALRVIIPPLISQYLNLTKNSSLAIVIGYADLFFVGRTIINQAGQAVPVFLLIMAIYLGLSLLTSAVLNLYNRRVQLVER
ncbi:MAG TPA: ABC transporter permease subunit [Anaerolineae bacterium]|nr:ABC transporter permease subunit [Anaerolineae bacterium]HNU04310.1 ABC transporter permease subunit [Anaerolineae bacterium]